MSLVLAHRGASGHAPENTLEAFRLAMEMGADGFELDVHMSLDGELVVIHDESVDRTTDGTGLVRDLTLAQLKELDACNGMDYILTIPLSDLAAWWGLITSIYVLAAVEHAVDWDKLLKVYFQKRT